LQAMSVACTRAAARSRLSTEYAARPCATRSSLTRVTTSASMLELADAAHVEAVGAVVGVGVAGGRVGWPSVVAVGSPSVGWTSGVFVIVGGGWDAVLVGVRVGVLVSVRVAEAVGLAVDDAVKVADGVSVGVSVGVEVEVSV